MDIITIILCVYVNGIIELNFVCYFELFISGAGRNLLYRLTKRSSRMA
jgi:hypothetical protein